MADDYAVRVAQERLEKDHWFATGHDSPIPHASRHGFRGLNYYPIEPSLRVRARISEDAEQAVLTFPTSKGTEQQYVRFGAFNIHLGDDVVRLHAYRPVHVHGSRDSLFVPFRDATSGKESYGAGRYLDLEFDPSGDYEVDFNRAYSPYCAYSDDYVCPLPPPENWLKVPIRAGEKVWP